MGPICRICGSSSLSDGVKYRPYANMETTYYDCVDCGSRFVSRDEFIYEQLHSLDSTYSAHRELSNQAKALYDNRDIEGLRKYLAQTPKNRPVINHLRTASDCHRVLEFGCSRGYLSSFAVLLGKEFYGVDISETAVNAACESFGDHFMLERDIGSLAGQKFDFIYHVGTIGCVDNPIEFVKNQLNMLRPGGVLIFNAPNIDACRQLHLDWVMGTTPPDLVTLFPPSFWGRYFTDLAQVEVTIGRDTPLQSYLRRRNARRAKNLGSRELFASSGPTQKRNSVVKLARQTIKRLAFLLPPVGPFARLSQEFGVHIKMTAK